MEIETLGFQNHVSLGVKLSEYVFHKIMCMYTTLLSIKNKHPEWCIETDNTLLVVHGVGMKQESHMRRFFGAIGAKWALAIGWLAKAPPKAMALGVPMGCCSMRSFTIHLAILGYFSVLLFSVCFVLRKISPVFCWHLFFVVPARDASFWKALSSPPRNNTTWHSSKNTNSNGTEPRLQQLALKYFQGDVTRRWMNLDVSTVPQGSFSQLVSEKCRRKEVVTQKNGIFRWQNWLA